MLRACSGRNKMPGSLPEEPMPSTSIVTRRPTPYPAIPSVSLDNHRPPLAAQSSTAIDSNPGTTTQLRINQFLARAPVEPETPPTSAESENSGPLEISIVPSYASVASTHMQFEDGVPYPSLTTTGYPDIPLSLPTEWTTFYQDLVESGNPRKNTRFSDHITNGMIRYARTFSGLPQTTSLREFVLLANYAQKLVN